MLNFKKGLAMVLAAATAFTFAPLTGLSFAGSVDAHAANVPVATPSGTVYSVNGYATGQTDEYDVFVKAGSTYQIVDGNTKIGTSDNATKTSDGQYDWHASSSDVSIATFSGTSSSTDGIADVTSKTGKGLSITASGMEDSNVNGTTIYLYATHKDAAPSTSDPHIKVNVHVYKNTGTLTFADNQISVNEHSSEDIASEINLAESGNLYVINKGNRVSTVSSSDFTLGQTYFSQKNGISLSVGTVGTSNTAWTLSSGAVGTYNETLHVGYVYKHSFEYAEAGTVINVKDASDVTKVIDANNNVISYAANETLTDVQKAGITLTKGQTFDLGALTAAYNGAVKVNDAKFTFESNSAAVTIDKDGKGILTGASKTSNAVIAVTGKEGSRELGKVYVNVKVNELAADELTVKDAAGNTYTNVPQYATYYDNNNVSHALNLEENKIPYTVLAQYFENIVKAKDSKIAYVTLDLDSNKTVSLTATSANGYSLPAPVIANTQLASGSASTVVTSGLAGGKVTLTAKTAGYAVIKFTSQDSTKALGGTAYVFVRVLSHPESTIYGLKDSYNLAYGSYVDYTSGEREEHQYALDLGKKLTTNGGSFTYELLSKKDYPNDDPTAVKLGVDRVYNNGHYYTYSNGIVTAYKANATAHIKVTAVDGDNTSSTSKIIEIKTVAPKQNSLTVSVVSGSAIGATLTISSVTNLTVSADYLDKGINVGTNNANSDAAVLATTDYINTVTLYPNKKGNAKITVFAAGDGETIAPAQKQIIVTYGTTAKPSKVTGLKVTNKKGAKVTVKFHKVTTYSTMKYYVQKKIGSKASGKSVGSTKTTLSVAKGKTVKVRVKAYYYDENGTKHVGKWSSWKTLKTDKK